MIRINLNSATGIRIRYYVVKLRAGIRQVKLVPTMQVVRHQSHFEYHVATVITGTEVMSVKTVQHCGTASEVSL